MQLTTEFTPPAYLTGYARASLAEYEVNTLALSAWLPSDDIPDLVYRFAKGEGGLTEAAVYRAYDSESDIARRPGATRVSGMLPPISRKMLIGEYQRIKERSAARNVEEQEDKLFDDAARLTRAIGARVELARGDALFNGSVTINENGVQANVDFGRDPSHSVVLDGTGDETLWNDPDESKPFDNLSAWTEAYIDTNGSAPAYVMMPESVARMLCVNAQLCRMSTTDVVPPSRLNMSALNALLKSHDLPEVVTNDSRVSFKGVATRITPADKVCLLPDRGPALGRTLWGVPVEAEEVAMGIPRDERSGVLVSHYMSEDPQTLWTRATAIVLPVLAAPDLTFVAKVV
ncbi:major capsid protein [Streptomyces sp. NPDC090301]|uniref:major capsid protein n=1 Tax=Streptomyces sp. NPDC090301 TaxID=3154975 RepID=UPI00341B498E